MNKTFLFILLSCALVFILALNACGQNATSQTVTSTASKPAAAAIAGNAAKPVAGGTLRFGINQDYPTIGNPITQTYQAGYALTDICLEGLITLNSKGEPVPLLATSWKFGEDSLSLTFSLRKDVKFHDGTPFNAAAAKWNFDQLLLAKKTELASVKSVDAIDDATIKLSLTQPDGLLLVYLAGTRGLMMSPTAFQKAGATDKERGAWAESHPVGTGPFKFVNWEHDVKMEFEKFTDYWQKGKPYLDRIVFRIIANETTMSASLKAGELDIISLQQPQVIKDIEDTGKYNLLKGDVSTLNALEGDSKHADSPWANIKVRQGAAYAIDNEQYAKTIGYGYWKASNQFDVPERWGYNPNVVGNPYNVEKAKSLMKEAGYEKGFTTNLYGMAQSAAELTAIQGYLSKIGINAQPKIITAAERVDMFGKSGWNGLWLWGCTVQPSTLVNMGRNFTAAAAPARMISVEVPADFSALVAKATAATDFKTQQELTWQLEKELVDKYAFLTFIYGQYSPLPMTKNVHDLQNNVTNHWTPWDTWLEK